MEVLLSLALEMVLQRWWVSMDVYEDFKNDGYDTQDPEFWYEIHLTPAIALLLANLMIFANLVSCLFLDMYTKVS